MQKVVFVDRDGVINKNEFDSVNKKAILWMVNQVSDNLQIGMQGLYVDKEHKRKTNGGRYKEFMADIRIEQESRPIYLEKEGSTKSARYVMINK